MKKLEEMKDYDIKNIFSTPVYIVYGMYEWTELCQKMIESEVFTPDEDHRDFNLNSLEIFLNWRYGNTLDSPQKLPKFCRANLLSRFKIIEDKLSAIGYITSYKKEESAVSKNFYRIEDEFYKSNITQLLDWVLPRTPVADPNLGCLDDEQLKAKLKYYKEEKILNPKFSRETITNNRSVKLSNELTEKKRARKRIEPGSEHPTVKKIVSIKELTPQEAKDQKSIIPPTKKHTIPSSLPKIKMVETLEAFLHSSKKYNIIIKEFIFSPNGEVRCSVRRKQKGE